MDAGFPKNANGDALRRLQEDGDDLSLPRAVDFTVVFSNEVAAGQFATPLRQLGYEVSWKETHCVPELPWDVVVSNNMVPSYSAISEFEAELERRARTLEGRNDGWGCFAQKR